MLKALGMASSVTLISIPILGVFHIAAPLFAPVIGGYWAGSNLRLSDGEVALLALGTALITGLPLPAIQQGFGYFHYLSPVTIDLFAVVFAIYNGGLVGLAAWLGTATAIEDGAVS
ncbi:MAG TPA: hypothetical protein VHA53_06145 [Nitrolancea sp.]|jgi:hypothetical protein|nr:hypothetical protein [Nitrolancea sp.]